MKLPLLVPHNPPRYTLRWRQNATHNIPTLYISNITLSVSGGPGNNIRNCTLNGFDSNGYVDVHVMATYSYSYDIAVCFNAVNAYLKGGLWLLFRCWQFQWECN